jgi:hypothetical protein
MIVPADLQVMLQQMVVQVAGPPAEGMFQTALSAITDPTTPTHYASSGAVAKEFADVLADPAIMHQACVQAGVSITLEECQAILDRCDITDEEPFAAMARLNLQMLPDPNITVTGDPQTV